MGGIQRFLMMAVVLLSVSMVSSCTEESHPPVSPAARGPLPTYQPRAAPKGLVLLLSDQAGWTPTLATMGRKLAEMAYFVVGVDSHAYLQRLEKEARPCVPGGLGLDALGHDLMRQHGIEHQKLPILVGLGQGAAMAYTAVAYAPSHRFHAAVSLDFCPLLPMAKPLCVDRGAPNPAASGQPLRPLAPKQQLGAPWFLFQDRHHQGCDLESVTEFVHHVNDARLVVAPADADSKNAAQADQQQQFLALMQWLDPSIAQQGQSSTALSGLPLIEKPAAAGKDDLAVLLSGDGGWAAIDKGIAAELVKRQISTVGWDSLTYFWKPHPPERAAADMARVLAYYLEAWHKQRVILIGYSFGADALPFIVTRLPARLRDRLEVLALVGLSPYATFEFHLTQWLGATPTKAYPVAPELAALSDIKVLCVVGKDETDSLCPALHPPVVVRQVPGNHHFNHDYARLVSDILASSPLPATR